MNFDHNKLIAEAAKQVLLPAGLKRVGKSRLYYDDNGWWCGFVEFQPSSWSKGSYLNVGVSWLLYERDHWAFNISDRVEGFSSAKDENQFKEAVLTKAKRSKEIVESYREKLPTTLKAYEYYKTLQRQKTIWDNYYEAVFAGMSGEFSAAKANFNSLVALPKQYDWEKELNSRALELLQSLNRPKEFIEAVTGIVLRTRTLLHLENKEPAQLGLPSVEEF
jgi:hypothetical protein